MLLLKVLSNWIHERVEIRKVESKRKAVKETAGRESVMKSCFVALHKNCDWTCFSNGTLCPKLKAFFGFFEMLTF